MADWVIVPAPRRRAHEVRRLLRQLNHQADCVVVVTTSPDPVQASDVAGFAEHVVRYEPLGMLYGQWINAGLDEAKRLDPDARYALILGSDTQTDSHALCRLVEGMQRLDLVMGGPDIHRRGDRVLGPHRDVYERVPPEFFVLDLRTGLRFDPEFRWWYGEDDLEMQARQLGNVGIISNVWMCQEQAGHVLSAVQAQHATEDRRKFIEKWGIEPW